MTKVAAIVVLLITSVLTDFTPHFRKFLHESYGIAITDMLERTDLGLDASFGGKESAEEKPTNQPVIIVHGITNKATRFQVG